MAVALRNYHGVLVLQGTHIDRLAAAALDSSPDKNFFDSPRKDTAIELDTQHIFSLGIGGKIRAGVYWIVIVWAAGQKIRKQLGLPPKHFHITLSSNDVNDIDKGIWSLLSQLSPRSIQGDILDHVIFTLQLFGDYSEAKAYAAELASDGSISYKGFLRLADAAFSMKEFKLAMLSYACAWERVDDTKAKSYCLRRLIDCSKATEWGHVFQEREISQLDSLGDLSPALLAPWSEDLMYILSEQKLSPVLLL